MTSQHPHNFGKSLSFANSSRDHCAWATCYEHYWPGRPVIDRTEDPNYQLRGIDRTVALANGTNAEIEEKSRDRFYSGDILLELVSDVRRKTDGWLVDLHKQSTHLAVLYKPSELCFLFPFDELKRAWTANETRWKYLAMGDWTPQHVRHWSAQEGNQRHVGEAGFSLVRACSENQGRRWTTFSICVPERQLMAAVLDSIVWTWSKPGDLALRAAGH